VRSTQPLRELQKRAYMIRSSAPRDPLALDREVSIELDMSALDGPLVNLVTDQHASRGGLCEQEPLAPVILDLRVADRLIEARNLDDQVLFQQGRRRCLHRGERGVSCESKRFHSSRRSSKPCELIRDVCCENNTSFMRLITAWLPLCTGLRASAARMSTSALSSHARIVLAAKNTPTDPVMQQLAEVDASFATRVVTSASREHTRVVLSPCGSLLAEHDDIRRVADAAERGAAAAFAMGATELSLEVSADIAATVHPVEGVGVYEHAALVAQLGVFQQAYVPLQAREARPDAGSKLSNLFDTHAAATAIEEGRKLARDIGSGDPERMSPLKLAEYVRSACEEAGIAVEVLDDLATLQAEYPLLHAVARASIEVERHRPAVVRLVWSGSGKIERTVCIAGKGVTYDVGGADIKVGGSMAGMRRDKCGAAAAAGFILSCARAAPELTKGLKVVVELGCVRNSIGADAFVADEVISGHAGKRVLIGNTDAEGRLVLADVLSHLRSRVTAQPDVYPQPVLLSLATLTGHATRSFGPYACATDSGAARAAGGLAPRLAHAGARLGQPLEVSSLRREDFAFVAPGSRNTPVSAYGGTYDVLQCNNAPSAITTRGHQFPMAFLLVASGLEDHGAGSALPLPYCHIDLADSVADARGVETGSPILALFGYFLMRL